eukprot:605874-Rhodomonas_salina.2
MTTEGLLCCLGFCMLKPSGIRGAEWHCEVIYSPYTPHLCRPALHPCCSSLSCRIVYPSEVFARKVCESQQSTSGGDWKLWKYQDLMMRFGDLQGSIPVFDQNTADPGRVVATQDFCFQYAPYPTLRYEVDQPETQPHSE